MGWIKALAPIFLNLDTILAELVTVLSFQKASVAEERPRSLDGRVGVGDRRALCFNTTRENVHRERVVTRSRETGQEQHDALPIVGERGCDGDRELGHALGMEGSANCCFRDDVVVLWQPDANRHDGV